MNECILETGNLGNLTGCALLVSFGLGNAISLDLCNVLQDSSELSLNTTFVRAKLSHRLVQAGTLLGLVLHVLLLCGHLDLVLLVLGLVCCDGALLCCLHLFEALGEVRLADFKQTDYATAGTIRGAVGFVCLCIIIVEHLERHLNTVQALLHLTTVLIESTLLFTTDPVHLNMFANKLHKLCLKDGDLVLQLCRAG